MKKANPLFSLLPFAYFALASLGCTRTDSLGAAGSGGTGSGGATSAGGSGGTATGGASGSGGTATSAAGGTGFGGAGGVASGGAGATDGGAGIQDAGATDANATCDSQPLTQEQATALFRDVVYRDIPTYNPVSVFSVAELQVPGAWDAMGIQLFTGGSVDDYGYVVNQRPFVTRACKLYPLTTGSATSLLSAVLVGSTLYYTVSAGSGINYTELGRISLSGGGLQILQGPDYGRPDPLNLYLRESGGQIVVDLGDHGTKFNSWSARSVFGWLRDDGASLVVVDAAGTVIPYDGVGGW